MIINLSQGAEARVFLLEWGQKRVVCKQRFKKKWRHPQLDEKITLKRVIQEARSLERCHLKVRVPQLYLVDHVEMALYMEYIDFPSLRTCINAENCVEIGKQIGKELAIIHGLGVIHGDLTTSNMLWKDNQLVWIDFGLSYVSVLPEDKAVDIYVLERAITSTHPQEADQMLKTILDTYETEAKQGKEIIKRFQQVRMRGRKRTAFG
ncbi:kinase-like domain-containing protein [Gorgonomyces haynaldii]|nr:kinase-like domain-containing protein [Gorgonomyces haynaldii]